MSKLSDAKEILNALQVPTKQQNGMCCCVLLAMAGLTEELPWSEATNNWIRIHDVIAFANSNYGMTYAENSRETFRRRRAVQPSLLLKQKDYESSGRH